MKLLRLSIDGEYKSLSDFEYVFKSLDYNYDAMEPICFVGLNGSGKSNIIEALSEIFCFLELYCLDYGARNSWAKKATFTFDLAYSLLVKNKDIEVCISALKGKTPNIKVKSKKIETTDKDVIFQWLPDRIIGYTSGDNETISFSFMRNQGFYANEIADVALKKREEISIRHTRTLFMDYDINALILITNYLFCSQSKLEIFHEFLRIKGVASFRIKVALEKKARKKIKITQELKEIINKLKSCALLNNYKEDEKTWVFDFIINKSTRQSFKYHFSNAVNLFTALYKLNLLNSLRLTGSEREFYISQPKKNALLEKPPVVPKEDRAFLVDQVKLDIDKPAREIDYVGISDGEHQFIHIIGTMMLFNDINTLFLFDEPESHFNPNWRSKFINIMSRQVASKQPEFILSTHSPYVVSGCKSHNVVKFTRDGDKVNQDEPNIKTFGATFDSLLNELFDIKSSIAKYSSEELNKLLKENNLEKLQQAVGEYGESPEKRRLYEAVIRLEEEMQGY